ncbi:MAG: hypothetical protein AB7P20_06180 [Rhizobiaceae bacterium]
MDPADLLFADTRRIDRYFTQIGGRTGRLKLSGSINLSWKPSLKLRATQKETKPTPYDKIDGVKKYLEKRSLLRFGRPKDTDTDTDVDFVEEICTATKIEIPPRPHAEKSARKIVLWACRPGDAADQSGVLILVQDFNYPDERATSFQGTSTFSVLSALVFNTRKEIDQSILNMQLRHEPHPNPYAKFGTESHPWSLSEYHSVREHIYEFATNPAELLRSWNCAVYPERRISVVYKVREWGRDSAHSWQKTTVFGYPLWIFAA